MASGLVTLDDIIVVDSMTLLCTACIGQDSRIEFEIPDDGEIMAISVAEAQQAAVAHIRERH
jgi:hypothetical protein